MIHLRTLALVFLAALGLVAAASAQNLLTNPDFDAGSGLTSWFPTAGTWVLGADSGSCLLSNSAEGTSGDTSGGQYLQLISQQCIPVDAVATPTLFLGGLYRTPANVSANIFLLTYATGTCEGPPAFGPTVFGGISPGWAAILGPVSIPPSVGSVAVWVEFVPLEVGQPQYTGSFDRLYFGVLPQIFVDGFEAESGSACHWSSIVP